MLPLMLEASSSLMIKHRPLNPQNRQFRLDIIPALMNLIYAFQLYIAYNKTLTVCKRDFEVTIGIITFINTKYLPVPCIVNLTDL